VRALQPDVAVQLRQSFAEDPKINQLIDAEIDAWWRDLVATIDDDHDQAGWLGNQPTDDNASEQEPGGDAARLGEGSAVRPLPVAEQDASSGLS
jgi:hypothetical protein